MSTADDLPFPLEPDQKAAYNLLSQQAQRIYVRIYTMWLFLMAYEGSYCEVAYPYDPLSNGLEFQVMTDGRERFYALSQWILGINLDSIVLSPYQALYIYTQIMSQLWKPSEHAFYEQRADQLVRVVTKYGSFNEPAPWPGAT